MINHSFFIYLILMFLFMLIFMMLAIAFVTLFERHVLALSQNRKAPSKPSLFGALQPVYDGFKLFNKEVLFGYYVSDLYFLSIPFFTFFFMIMEWGVVPYMYVFFSFDLSYLFFMALVGGLVYMMLLIGLYSKSKYSLLGAVRSSCQSVSFEVVFFFLLFSFVGIGKCLVISWWSSCLLWSMVPIFLLMVIAELNRPPFDFSEGESELVSGFNLELGGYLFVLLFLSEYGFLLFFSYLMSVMLFGGSWLFFYFFFFILLGIRSSYPRYRYDKLMGFFWFQMLPLIMFVFFFVYVCCFY